MKRAGRIAHELEATVIFARTYTGNAGVIYDLAALGAARPPCASVMRGVPHDELRIESAAPSDRADQSSPAAGVRVASRLPAADMGGGANTHSRARHRLLFGPAAAGRRALAFPAAPDGRPCDTEAST